MSKEVKSTVKYVIGIYILIFTLFYLIPLWIGNFYGTNFRYEFILAIIVGLPLSCLILQEKTAKNLFRKASENFDFEVNRKKEHENHIESQKAVFRFIPKEYIRSDMGKRVESYFHTKEYDRAKKELENAKERLSNIEIFISFLKVIALWVGAFHFFQAISENKIGEIEDKIDDKVEQSEFISLQDSVELNFRETTNVINRITPIETELQRKIEQSDLTLLRDSVESNFIKFTNNKMILLPVKTKIEQIEYRLEIIDSIVNEIQQNEMNDRTENNR